MKIIQTFDEFINESVEKTYKSDFGDLTQSFLTKLANIKNGAKIYSVKKDRNGYYITYMNEYGGRGHTFVDNVMIQRAIDKQNKI
jgi:hypothetical protein